MSVINAPAELSRGHAAEARFRRELANMRYRNLVESRRGAVLYTRSLARALGHLPQAREIESAYKRYRGPRIADLTASFNGSLEVLLGAAAIDYEEHTLGSPTTSELERMARIPHYPLLQDMVQRHPDTELAKVYDLSEGAYGIANNVADTLRMSFDDLDGKKLDFRIDANLDGTVYFHTIEYLGDDNFEEKGYEIVAARGLIGIWGYDMDRPRFLKKDESDDLLELLHSIHGRLEQEGQLVPRYRDDIDILPDVIGLAA